MADDWQVGDLALCIAQSWHKFGFYCPNDPVRAGGIYTVRAIGKWRGITIIWIEGVGGDHVGDAYEANAFRKVTPPEADEFDRETIDLMNGAPVGEPVA